MMNTVHTPFTQNVLPRRYQQPQRVTPVRGVGQDKPRATPDPRRISTAWVTQKEDARASKEYIFFTFIKSSHKHPMNAGRSSSYPFSYLAVNCFLQCIGTVGSMEYHLPPPSVPHQRLNQTPRLRKRSTKRQKVKLSIWVDPPEQKELARLAESEGLSLSRTGRAIIVDGIRQRLRLEREVLTTPILEAFFDKKMNQFINRLSEFLGRNVYETGQLRWLYVNALYREVLNPDKRLTKEEFYKLLDTSEKETVKAAKQWHPNIKDVVDAIKQWLKEGESS